MRFAHGEASALKRRAQGFPTTAQVFASYGEKTSGQLLLSYGFGPVHDNPHDGCDLPLGLDADDPQHDAKAALLAERGMEATVEFPLKLGGWPAAMLPYAAFACVSTDSMEELRYVAAQLFDGHTFPSTLGRGLEAAAAMHVLDRCKAALAGYASSLQGDLAVIEELSWVDQAERCVAEQRKLLMAAIRIIERRALERTVFTLADLRKRTLR
jgi:histone-lysine N-methyltransferase SETD3